MLRAIIIAIASAALLAACAENETTIYVEHVKAQPAAPDCAYSAGDAISPRGSLDLSFNTPYTAGYLLTNQLLPRENTSNFVAESNGVIIEGMEVYVRDLSGALVGANVYYEFEFFLPPGTSDVAYAVALPAPVVAELAARYACAPLNATNYPAVAYTGGLPLPWVRENLGTVYSEVRFLGHTAGGTDVETPVFTYPIDLCCGCLVNWYNCADDCARYCQEPEASGMCTDGIGNGEGEYDCKAIYYNPGTASWSDPDLSDECAGGATCTCDDCEG